jgi:hypothetical protein
MQFEREVKEFLNENWALLLLIFTAMGFTLVAVPYARPTFTAVGIGVGLIAICLIDWLRGYTAGLRLFTVFTVLWVVGTVLL